MYTYTDGHTYLRGMYNDMLGNPDAYPYIADPSSKTIPYHFRYHILLLLEQDTHIIKYIKDKFDSLAISDNSISANIRMYAQYILECIDRVEGEKNIPETIPISHIV